MPRLPAFPATEHRNANRAWRQLSAISRSASMARGETSLGSEVEVEIRPPRDAGGAIRSLCCDLFLLRRDRPGRGDHPFVLGPGCGREICAEGSHHGFLRKLQMSIITGLGRACLQRNRIIGRGRISRSLRGYRILMMLPRATFTFPKAAYRKSCSPKGLGSRSSA